jgi:site-specific recombinase XerC
MRKLLKISARADNLIAMFSWLPQDSDKVFRTSLRAARASFNRQRNSAAVKLSNPRILQIHFHTFRHWRAKMEYHRTKDILGVKQLLGNKSLAKTLIYTQLVEFESDGKYCTATADTVEEAQKLIEIG